MLAAIANSCSGKGGNTEYEAKISKDTKSSDFVISKKSKLSGFRNNATVPLQFLGKQDMRLDTDEFTYGNR